MEDQTKGLHGPQVLALMALLEQKKSQKATEHSVAPNIAVRYLFTWAFVQFFFFLYLTGSLCNITQPRVTVLAQHTQRPWAFTAEFPSCGKRRVKHGMTSSVGPEATDEVSATDGRNTRRDQTSYSRDSPAWGGGGSPVSQFGL